MPLSKRADDYDKAEEKRIATAGFLNGFVTDFHIAMEKPMNKDKGMIFDVISGGFVRMRIKFLYKGGGLYDKIPKRYWTNPEKYLKWMSKLGVHLIVVNGEEFSGLISYDYIRKNWEYEMAKSETNKNRLIYFGPASTIECRPPDVRDIIRPSLIDQIREKVL